MPLGPLAEVEGVEAASAVGRGAVAAFAAGRERMLRSGTPAGGGRFRRSVSLAGIPGPWSLISSHISPLTVAVFTVTSPPPYFQALSIRLVLDRVAFRVIAVAFPIWTFGALIAGPIWAYEAWSRYWGWDPKEVWALITWIVYAGYLHARVTAGWRGRRVAILCLIGFATFLFSFYGVNLLFGGSQHTYAK